MVKTAKKRNVSNILQKKNHLLPKCQDLELEFSKESWSSVKKKFKVDLESSTLIL